MTGAQVDEFSSRLAREMAALDPDSRSELLLRIGRMDLRMRSEGRQVRPVWAGPVPEPDILGRDVVVDTDQGQRRGRVVCFGIVPHAGRYERSVVVLSEASGTHVEAPGSTTRLAGEADSERIREELAMARRLKEASTALQAEAEAPPEPVRRRIPKDPALISEMLDLAREAGCTVETGAGFHRIEGQSADRKVYLSKTQLRCDLSGFCADVPGVRPLSAEEAKAQHLGRVRGQLTFEDRDEALAAFKAAVKMLS